MPGGRNDGAGPDDPAPPARLWRFALALGIGVVGGLVFDWLTMPLPWMLGAMVFNTVAALVGVPVLSPVRVRPYVLVVIGVMLGSGFTPDILEQGLAWAVSLAFLGGYLLVSGLLVVPFYRRVGGYDPVTAYFAGMPGGLNDMILIGEERGGDGRVIALAHAVRIMLVVLLVALWFRLIGGHDIGEQSVFGVPFAEIPPRELVILLVTGVVGFFAGRWLRLPAPMMLGPMLASALVHLFGVAHYPPPSEVVLVAQLLMGTILGTRFVGSDPREVGRAVVLGLGASLVMLAVTAGFAFAFHGLFRQTVEQVVLAYAPGGLAEMSLVALAMNAEVAYVATHHMARIALVILFAPLAFALLRRRFGGRGGE